MWNDPINPRETLLIVLQSELPDNLQKALQEDPDGSHICFFQNEPNKDRVLYNNSFYSDEFREHPRLKLLMVAVDDNSDDIGTKIKEDIELIAKNDPGLSEFSNQYAMEKLLEMKQIITDGKPDRLNSETLDLVPNAYINATNIASKTHKVITREIQLTPFQT